MGASHCLDMVSVRALGCPSMPKESPKALNIYGFFNFLVINLIGSISIYDCNINKTAGTPMISYNVFRIVCAFQLSTPLTLPFALAFTLGGLATLAWQDLICTFTFASTFTFSSIFLLLLPLPLSYFYMYDKCLMNAWWINEWINEWLKEWMNDE